MAKLVSLVGQLVLGWYLSKDDFAVYAIAISVTSLAAVFRDAGATKLLIQRGREYVDLARPIALLALGFNCLAAVSLASVAPIIADAVGEPIVTSLILVLAVVFPLHTAPAIHRAKLATELRFREMTVISTVAAIVKNGALVAFAASGFGPLSFVLPQILVVIVEWIAYRYAAGPIPAGRPLDLPLVRELLASTKWIMFAGLAAAIIGNGDYLVVAKLAPDALGFYFFGFQLAGAFMVLFTQSLQSVLMPTFSRIADDRARIAVAYSRSVTVLASVGAYISSAIFLTAAPGIHFLWQGKWDSSIPVVQFIGLSFAFRLLSPVSGAMLEAMGYWRLRSCLIWGDGVLLLIAAGIGAYWGTPAAIAVAVCSQRILIGIAATAVATFVLMQPIWKTIIFVLCGAGVVASSTFIIHSSLGNLSWGQNAIIVAYLTVLVPIVVFLAKPGLSRKPSPC